MKSSPKHRLLLGVLVGTAIGVLLCMTVYASSINGQFEGYPIVRVYIDGTQVWSDVPAVNFHGRTMVPLRFVADHLGLGVSWDETTWSAKLTTQIAAQPAQPDQSQPPFVFSDYNLFEWAKRTTIVGEVKNNSGKGLSLPSVTATAYDPSGGLLVVGEDKLPSTFRAGSTVAFRMSLPVQPNQVARVEFRLVYDREEPSPPIGLEVVQSALREDSNPYLSDWRHASAVLRATIQHSVAQMYVQVVAFDEHGSIVDMEYAYLDEINSLKAGDTAAVNMTFSSLPQNQAERLRSLEWRFFAWK